MENNGENTRVRWINEVNRIVMRCFFQSDPIKNDIESEQ